LPLVLSLGTTEFLPQDHKDLG